MSRYLRVLAAIVLVGGLAAAFWLPTSNLDLCGRLSFFECGANSGYIIRAMIAAAALLSSIVLYSLSGLIRR
jgi:hypothetical protein